MGPAHGSTARAARPASSQLSGNRLQTAAPAPPRSLWEAAGPAPSNVARSAASRWQCPATRGAASTMIAPRR
eukprot:765540-Alexandrium_andersonii.AAC.1